MVGPGICPVNAMWGWRYMSIHLYGELPDVVFSCSVNKVRQAFQQIAAAQLGGVLKVQTHWGLVQLRMQKRVTFLVGPYQRLYIRDHEHPLWNWWT